MIQRYFDESMEYVLGLFDAIDEENVDTKNVEVDVVNVKIDVA